MTNCKLCGKPTVMSDRGGLDYWCNECGTQTLPKDTYPYCGGCGHNFFNAPMITKKEAEERAKRTLCHYCVEEKRNA